MAFTAALAAHVIRVEATGMGFAPGRPEDDSGESLANDNSDN